MAIRSGTFDRSGENVTPLRPEAVDGQPPPPHPPDMNERVAKLETTAEFIRRDLDDIKTDLKAAVARLSALPTREQLFGYTATVAALAFAIIAIFVGVLAYLQDQRIANRPEPPQAAASAPPIIVNIPSPAQATK